MILAQVCETCGRAAGMGWPAAILLSVTIMVAAVLLVFGVIGAMIAKMVRDE